MPIVVMRSQAVDTMLGEDGGTAPVVVCDHCEGIITKASGGVYVWDPRALPVDRATAPILIAHKGECHEALDQQLTGSPSRRAPWHELEFLFRCLVKNADVDLEPYEGL
jgi:hypothetical protein